MLKVCHVTSAHNSDDTRIFHKECVSLAEAGYAVFLVAPGEDREEKGVRVMGVGPRPEGTLRRIASGFPRAAYRRALALECDVYHLHDPELLPFALRLRRKGKRVIFDSHEYYAVLLYEKAYIPRFLRSAASRLFSALERYVYRRIDGVVIPCTLDGRDPFADCARRTAMVDNLPEAGSFIGPQARTEDSADTVGYLGSITYNRGATFLVKACAAAGARLRLAGSVWPAYLEELQAMPEYGDTDYVGLLPYGEIPAFCRSIRVGMCTVRNVGQYIRTDNLSTKVYEYLGAGLPVILSDTPSARELLSRYDCGVCVDPDDIDAIARAIRALLDDPERAARMGAEGYKAVTETYNWSQEEKKLLALYREVTA